MAAPISSLLWLESTALSTWLRESEDLWALPGALFMHSLAMGFVAGLSMILCLRACGMAAAIPATTLRDFAPLVRLWWWTSLLTGVLLLIAYPTKALTNPVFYLKMAAVTLAVIACRQLIRDGYGVRAPPSGFTWRTRRLALLSLAGWCAAIVLGRMLAYTYRHLMADSP